VAVHGLWRVLQDDIQITPRLTVNLGLRFERIDNAGG
jgi:hypothetical protein